MNLWKQAVRLAFESVEENGVAVVTPDAEDGIDISLDEGLLFYDCGTPTRRLAVEKPSQRVIRGWLWGLRHDPLWSKGKPAFVIIADGNIWNCTIGVLVSAEMSSILNPADTMEFS
jgi:hypothetical protein